MKRPVKAIVLLAVLLLSATLPEAATPEQIRDRVGVYIWGNVADLSAAVDDARGLGADRVVRAFIGPWSDTPPYHDDTRPLAQKLEDPAYRKLISQFTVIMLTAYDSYSYEREYGEADTEPELRQRAGQHAAPLRPNHGKIERPTAGVAEHLAKLSPAEAAHYLGQVRREFAEFSFALARHDRTFILSNWEAENDVPDVKHWPQFQRYLQARIDGIVDGRARAARAKLPGRVRIAFEFTIVPGFEGRQSGLERMGKLLRGVEYLSYSSWWSIGHDYDWQAMSASFRESIRRIRGSAAKNQRIIIGEFGEYWDVHPDAVRLRAIVDASIEEGAEFLFNWTLYDQPGERDEHGRDASHFGKYTQQRELTPQGRAMKAWLRGEQER